MQRMSLDKETVAIDYTAAGVPASVQNFRPHIFKDGENYYCILGSDENAVYGIGNTIAEALDNFDRAYQEKQSH